MPRNRPGGARRRALAGAVLGVAACLDAPSGIAVAPPLPEIASAAVRPGPHNVLSALVAVRTSHADSVVAWYRLDDSTAATDSLTAAVTLAGDSAMIPVLGLLPGSRYRLGAIAYGPGGLTRGAPLTFTTDTLPSDLPRYTAGGPDPTPGFVVFAAGRYGLVIDNDGRVVWYRRFEFGPGLNFQVQPTGSYYVRPPTPDPIDREPWLELDALGTVTRAFGCANGLQPRFHDLIARTDGSYWIMCDETRTMDLTAVGGVANAQVMGTVVQHVSAAGVLLFQWSPFDHFALTDLDAASRAGSSVNWTHGNALDLDADGNLFVSFRSLSEITKIDGRTGRVLWRMGGPRNAFVFAGAALPTFSRQHGLRLTGQDRFVLLDNLGDSTASRAERYVFDEAARSVRQVGAYESAPAVTALLGGTTQQLPRGRVLVAYGNGGRVEEYDPSGQVVWRIEGDPGYVFRAQRIQSLYHPGVGSPR